MKWDELQEGFYYHYKHDASKGLRDYAYEVIAIGHHTEINDWESGVFVIYRPLYESAKVFKAGGIMMFVLLKCSWKRLHRKARRSNVLIK